MLIEGSVVVVTGGQRGLGKALTEAFLAAGASKVYATARAPQSSEDPRIVPVALEVTDASSVAALCTLAHDATIVVNNAGMPQRTPLLEVDVDDARKAFDTNVLGPLQVARGFAPVLAANGGGALANVLSVMSWAAGAATYGATKAALWSLTNSLRVELAPVDTQVVGVHLSWTETDMTASLDLHMNTPANAAKTIVDGIASGAHEILVDDDSRMAKSLLSGPPDGLAYEFVEGRMTFVGASA